MFYKLEVAVCMPRTSKYRAVGVFGEFDSLDSAVSYGVSLLGGQYGKPIKNHNITPIKKSNRKGNMCRW